MRNANAKLERAAYSRPFALQKNSVKVEVDVNQDAYGYGDAVFLRRLETPFLHGLDRLLVQSHTQRTRDLHVAHTAIRAYDANHGDRTLIFGFARLFAELRLGAIDRYRGANTATHAKYSAAGIAAAARSKSDAAAAA